MPIPIALDVDGVLGDFETHWRTAACERLNRPVDKVSEQYGMHLRYGLTDKEVAAVQEACDQRWADLPLYDTAPELVRALEELGCTVWAITAVAGKHHAARARNLAGLIAPERIVCVGHDAASTGAKTAVLRDIGAHAGCQPVAFLDDHPANVNAALGVVSLPVLLDLGYLGLKAPEYGVTVIDDALDFPVLVETLLKRTGRAAGRLAAGKGRVA